MPKISDVHLDFVTSENRFSTIYYFTMQIFMHFGLELLNNKLNTEILVTIKVLFAVNSTYI